LQFEEIDPVKLVIASDIDMAHDQLEKLSQAGGQVSIQSATRSS